MKTLYHATDYDNIYSIAATGLELRNAEQLIYCCEKPEDCLKFALIHGVRHVLVLKVEADDKDVVETFDHSESFFKCRCYGITKPLPTTQIKEYFEYKYEGDN